MRLVDVYETGEAGMERLYALLCERTPEQSISHKAMPTYEQHRAFVQSRPYLAWYLIQNGDTVGCTYLSKRREIGVSVFRRFRRLGYGRHALQMLMDRHPGSFLANINPRNEASAALFKGLGFALLQVTYAK